MKREMEREGDEALEREKEGDGEGEKERKREKWSERTLYPMCFEYFTRGCWFIVQILVMNTVEIPLLFEKSLIPSFSFFLSLSLNLSLAQSLSICSFAVSSPKFAGFARVCFQMCVYFRMSIVF